VVYLSLSSLFGANFALQFDVNTGKDYTKSTSTYSSSVSSALRTFEKYVFLSLETCIADFQQDGRVVRRETCVPQLELVRSS